MNLKVNIAALSLGLLALPSLATPQKAAKTASNTQTVTVTVDGSGYHPSIVSVKAGKPVRMVFVSKGSGCANKIVIPALNQKFRLRKGQQRVVSFTPKKGQSLAFACDMDMFRGKAVAK